MTTYQVGGSLNNEDPNYVTRQADIDLYNALSAGEFCYVFNSRQMGKSSLMVRTMHRLQEEGISCVAIDMTLIGSENITPDQWYKGLAVELWQSFGLFGQVNFKAWWNERLDISLAHRLGQFIEEVLLVEVETPHGLTSTEEHSPTKLVIFLDEIDSVLGLNFPVNDFFALIRFCYNQRSINPEYKRLTFALFGVATPSDLISDPNRTPFNIGRAIKLQGFRPAEAQPLANGLAGIVADPHQALQNILIWTGGQPFLTQKLCQLMVREHGAGGMRYGENEPALPMSHDASLIAELIYSHIIHNWESQDEPEHLRTISDRLLRNQQRAARLLGIYQQILQSTPEEEQGTEEGFPPPSSLIPHPSSLTPHPSSLIPLPSSLIPHPSSLTPLPSPVLADDSREHMELLLSGLVVNQGGRLVVKNPIYQAVFNAQWVSKQLTHLRPYSQTFDAWIAAQGQDESCLLRGQALQDALAWAMGKSLSDLDYQFLGASQDLAKRQAQTALEAVEQASQILATARQRAKQEFLKLRIGWGWIPLVATGVSVPILLLRLGGLLQGAEWNLFDQFVRWRPAEPPEQRVAIVIIDELDITKVGQWPIPDGVLAQAIKNIKAHKPRAIGLDIYRDLAVEPGHAELVNLFKSSPNLFGIEKVVQPTIAPPPVLSQLDQVGFADQVLDADGKLRRGLLSVIASDNQVRYSLAVKLALHYLEAEGLILEPLEGEPDRLRLGKAIFERFERNDGGYVRAQSGGYQILLNFRGNQEHFSTFSLRQVLANDIPPDSFRDRIVPIGTTAESINDFFYTPYSDSRFNSPKRMAGVTVHANIISEIISAALEGRALFRVWTDPIEWLWIFAWAGVGTAISWLWKSPSAIAALIIFVSSGLLGGCYLAFLLGWWLPFVPSLLVLLGSAIILPIITNKQLEKLQFRRTLAFLLEVCQDYPTAGRIAIEYLKQSESKENQTFIDRQLGNG